MQAGVVDVEGGHLALCEPARAGERPPGVLEVGMRDLEQDAAVALDYGRTGHDGRR